MSNTDTTLRHIWEFQYASDFAAGVRLLEEHNPGAVTGLILERLKKAAAPGKRPNRYELGKLGEALQKTVMSVHNIKPGPSHEGRSDAPPLAPAPPVQPVTSEPVAPVTAPAPVLTVTPPFGVGDEGGGLTSDRARELHKRHAHVHALMTAAQTDEERARYAAEIMQEIVPALDAEYDRLRALAAKGGTVEVDNAGTAPILNDKSADTLKKLNSVRARISKIRKDLPKATGKRKDQLEKELEEKTAEKERLEKLLS